MRRTSLPAPVDQSTPPTAAAAAPVEVCAPRILTFRAPSGVPFALEVCARTRWDDALLEPPDVEIADVRAVTLAAADGAPSRLPGWLAVTVGGPPPVWEGAAQTLWPASPHYRERAPSEAEFRAAGTAALRHAACGEVADPIDVARSDAGGAPPHGAACERWLHVRFGTPERFATLLLTRQIAERDPETAAALRFLDEAVVPEGGAWADLAVDRRVLLEQATPWRYFDRTFAPALAALGAWRRRYETAYSRHYARAREGAARARSDANRLLARATTADRLASVLACEGRTLAPRVQRAMATFAVLPPTSLPGDATTGGVRLGAVHPAVATLEALRDEVEEALDMRLRALSTTLAHRVLDREGDDLARVLDAIQASDVGDLDRVLDDRLAGYLWRVVRGVRGDDPLADIATRFPEVRADDLDAATEAFRDALAAAVRGAPDGVARLAR